jgi:predicted transcriptional regulator
MNSSEEIYNPYNTLLNLIVSTKKTGILYSELRGHTGFSQSIITTWINKLKKDGEIIVRSKKIGSLYYNCCYGKGFDPTRKVKKNESERRDVIFGLITDAEGHGILQSELVTKSTYSLGAVSRYIHQLEAEGLIVIYNAERLTGRYNICYLTKFAPDDFLKKKRAIRCDVILGLIREAGKCGILQSELITNSGFSSGTISNHLKSLKKLIVVYVMRNGKARYHICFTKKCATKKQTTIRRRVTFCLIREAGEKGILQSKLISKSGFTIGIISRHLKHLRNKDLIVVRPEKPVPGQSNTWYLKEFTPKD